MHLHEPPEKPWSKVEEDIFAWNGHEYLLSVDYYLSFWEFDRLESMKSRSEIQKLKSQIATFRIPDVVMTENGPQSYPKNL